jgi:hypothetical protein
MDKMTFAKAISSQEIEDSNGLVTYTGSTDRNVDLFYAIGASRGKNIIPLFKKAYDENAELACRIALYARDIRGGMGERKLYRDILEYLSEKDFDLTIRLLNKTPLVGRWDDIFSVKEDTAAFNFSLAMVKEVLNNPALKEHKGLLCKWLDRKGPIAVKVREYLKLSPKQYRKMLVNNTSVVEQNMCAKDWTGINYSHVPSVAAARYQKAFSRHDPDGYKEYRDSLVKNDGSAKINAGAVFPYDVIASLKKGNPDIANAQWNALENFVGDAKILPMVDVSGSMACKAGGYASKSSVSCMDVSISLGLYLADKNKGAFHGLYLSFSENSVLTKVEGKNLSQKYQHVMTKNIGYSTNLAKAFDSVLKTAVSNNVPQEEMPEIILIISDMNFNSTWYGGTSMAMITTKYQSAGYRIPKIVYWNVNDNGTTPVKANSQGIAMVSGFSPSIVRNILAAKDFSPKAIMLDAVMKDRYSI